MRAVPEQISAKAGASEEVVVLRHAPWEGLGAFAAGLEEWEIGWRYVDLFAGEPVPDLRAARVVFVMGGPMGVYDSGRYPFLSRELNAIREAVRENVPTLGVCLGAQLVAGALGATVGPNPLGPEIGWGP